MMYLAPKDRFDNNKKTGVIGAFRTLGSAMTNKLKPDVSHTWTSGVNYKISPSLEAPYINFMIRRRKHHLFEAYKGRSMYIGISPFVLNIEEIATVFHLPLSTDVSTAAVERIESKKMQPPANLPIAGSEEPL
jgi:hypothetical protein